MGFVGGILALEGRAAVEQEEEHVEDEEEQEQNVPPVAALLSAAAAVTLPGGGVAAMDTGDVGIWEGSSSWLWGGEWGRGAMGCVCGSDGKGVCTRGCCTCWQRGGC